MKCENCTGADLKSLLVNAQLEAVHDVMNSQLYNQGRETVNTLSNVMFFAIHILAHILPPFSRQISLFFHKKFIL